MMHTEKTLRLLADIQRNLQCKGLRPAVTEKNTLRLELSANGNVYAVQHIAIAEAMLGVLPGDNHDDELRDFWDYHYEELQEDKDKRVAVSLLLVGEDSFIYGPAFRMNLEILSLDTTVAKKHICGVSEVQDWAGNPFATWAAKATTPQVVHVVNVNRREWDAPEPTNESNSVFSRESLDTVANMLREHPRRAAIQALTRLLFRRIMGAMYQVAWADDDNVLVPKLGRHHDVTPLEGASSGEQLAFALALFLAKAHAEEQPGLYIHIPNVLYRFDSVRLLSVMDCLRDFLLATGASLFLEASNSTVLSWAKSRLSKLAFSA